MKKKRETRRGKRRPAPERPEVRPLFVDGSDESTDVPTPEAQDPTALAHRRVREGELYYVSDDAAPEGWSVVEIAGVDAGVLAAFAVGQLEAIPLDEIEDRILGPVAGPPSARRAA
ncbi:MAG: hypothetical protein QNK04_09635 [Myxococcota bacterium]|nr:hypothetical protein [Myxococcota bacterium]